MNKKTLFKIIITVVILFAIVFVYRQRYGVILNIPTLIGQPIKTVEKRCGVPLKIEADGTGKETRYYAKPLSSTINYDRSGRVKSVYIGPQAMFEKGLRFSTAKNWLFRFGFPLVPPPNEETLFILKWKDLNGLRITITKTVSADGGGDLGGDDNDVAILVSN